MNPIRAVRRRLGWKLFGSYVLIVIVGSVVLWTVAQWAAPTAFTHHFPEMMRMMGRPPAMTADLFGEFLGAMNTALAVAAITAFVTAVAVSLFVTRRIVAPIRSMTQATARIADGRYGERVLVTSEDELGRLATQFNRMATALERVEQMRRDLIADVAHELRTPLSSITGYMEGLLDGVIPAEPQTFHRLHREASRLQRLVDDLQELSRAEAGQISLRPRRITVQELVEVASGRLRSQFDGKGIALKIDIPRDLPPIMADPDRIAQVLTNLLGNALQYTPSGGSVEVRARPEAGGVAVTVTDTGIGIAAEHLPHVFDRFYRVDRSRARASGGTGIGLTVARHLAEAHRGSIAAESAGPGRGSTFTVILPIAS